MSQKKVEEYKKNKPNRNKDSKKESRRRTFEIVIVSAIIVVGAVWLLIAGISKAMTGNYSTIELNTEAIDNYIYNIDSSETTDDLETVESSSFSETDATSSEASTQSVTDTSAASETESSSASLAEDTSAE